MLVVGCGDSKVAQKESEVDPSVAAKPKVDSPETTEPVAVEPKAAEPGSADEPKAEVEPKAESNAITMEDFKGFLPDDPVESVELTEAEKQFASMGPPADDGEKIETAGFVFETPVRLKGGNEYVKVDQPGYACPTLADLNGDGKEELIVGQFSKGKMRMFENISTESDSPLFAEESWIMTGKKPAEVPGVW